MLFTDSRCGRPVSMYFSWSRIKSSKRNLGRKRVANDFNRWSCYDSRICYKEQFFEFNSKISQQISATVIGIKYTPVCACIFMDDFTHKFLKIYKNKPLVWFKYINVFLIWTRGKGKLKNFIDLNNRHHNTKSTYTASDKCYIS